MKMSETLLLFSFHKKNHYMCDKCMMPLLAPIYICFNLICIMLFFWIFSTKEKNSPLQCMLFFLIGNGWRKDECLRIEEEAWIFMLQFVSIQFGNIEIEEWGVMIFKWFNRTHKAQIQDVVVCLSSLLLFSPFSRLPYSLC